MMASQHESSPPMIKFNLITNDQVTFVVDKEFVKESTLLTEFIDCQHVSSDEPMDFPLPEVSSKSLSRLIELCKYYGDSEPYVCLEQIQASNSHPPVDREDMKYLAKLSTQQLHNFICASSFLNMPRLLDIGLYALNVRVRGKDVDEMTSYLKLKRDESSKDEPQLREHIIYNKLEKYEEPAEQRGTPS